MNISLDQFQQEGFLLIPEVFKKAELQDLIHEVEALAGETPHSGIRHTQKTLASSNRLISDQRIKDLCQSILGPDHQLVRAILFDKRVDRNWGVLWHQDKTIAVDKKTDIPNWGPWSIKANVHHVQPDISVLEKMLTIRIHLDEAKIDNGCLKVISGSHKNGILTQGQIERTISDNEITFCEANTGDTLLMRPHILHSSNKMTAGLHRRILHLEFSSYQLPAGLNWAQ